MDLGIIINGLFSGVVVYVYFETYKKIYSRLYGTDTAINYTHALLILMPIVLVSFLAVLGAYFLYKKYLL